MTANLALCCGVLLAAPACTLLIDRDSLTNAGAGGVGSSGAGTAGSAVAGVAGMAGTASQGGSAGCTPTDTDIDCDGLDQQCVPALQEATCPAGCTGTTRSGVSYMACTVSSSFDQAEARCQMQRMHLVAIDSVAENNFVVQLAQTLGSYVWIGGSNRLVDGAFAWPDGSAFYKDGAPVEGAYQNFGAGQPVADAARGCVQIHSDSPGAWSNTRCSDTLQFVCERY